MDSMSFGKINSLNIPESSCIIVKEPEKVMKELFIRHKQKLSVREPDSNKGTYGKLLIIAGSSGMAGAAYISGLAAFRSGIGMVKYFAPEANRIILQTLLPEAMYASCEGKELSDELDWADYVIVGPGLSKNEAAKAMVAELFRADVVSRLHKKKLVVIDADALNIIAEEGYDLRLLSGVDTIGDGRTKAFSNIVITPHMMEMLRLIKGAPSDSTNKSISFADGDIAGTDSKDQVNVDAGEINSLKAINSIPELKVNAIKAAAIFAAHMGINVILKDHETVIADRDGRVIKLSPGSGALAKAGSGDALCGFIAGISAVLKGNLTDALLIAVYLHGTAGRLAAEEKGEHSIIARDISENAGRALIRCLDKAEEAR